MSDLEKVKVDVRCSRCDNVLFQMEVDPVWIANAFTATGHCPYCDKAKERFVIAPPEGEYYTLSDYVKEQGFKPSKGWIENAIADSNFLRWFREYSKENKP